MPTAPTQLVHLNGTVRDNEGQAMGFIAVDFWAPGVTSLKDAPPGEPEYYRAITRSDGAFDVWLPARSYDIEIIPWDGSGYARAFIRSVSVKAGAPRLDYRYAWPRVTIRMVHPDSSVIPNSRASFWLVDPLVSFASTPARLESDVLKAVVSPGLYLVDFYPGGPESGYLAEEQSLRVSADTTITVTAGGYSVSVRVLGQNGIPLPGARVFTRRGYGHADVRTDTDGIAVFHLPSGVYSFSVVPSETYIASRGFPNRSVMGDGTFDLDVSGVVWSGTVRRSGDGAPLQGIRVTSHGGNGTLAYIDSDAAGAFHLIVQKDVVHDINLFDTRSGEVVGTVVNVSAGSDSTFDLFANVPIP
ncbi:MAG TPA: hypothetical protein VK123_07720 [Candidatus Limnocylindrales bacterium]|nr:hypothetical protein [Candidatus Limnocylindrales bacterium]